MRPLVAAALALAMAGVGFTAGRLFDRRPSAIAVDDAEVAPEVAIARPRAAVDDDPRIARDRRRAAQLDGAEAGALPSTVADGVTSQLRRGDDDREPDAHGDDELEGGAAAARQRELVGEVESCAELLGRPIPPRDDVESRFSRASLSRAVGQGIQQAGVAGDVEGVDCSEFPCIVFGRLAGDEADVEAIERSAALDPYEGDVLTLLLWATTVDEHARTHPTAQETGLFALAYYDAADRAEFGEELDRRIRARVLEVWNAERPGPPGG